MASYQESEHFAEDFREALEDLQVNNRYDIQNLTMIARENTEHALAIAQTLQNHIKRVASHKKLPSLYVLDSIIKNVGTPYTLFFGKRLFETYMNAYASVDMATRRKMDEMLKTWKEPIPGSIDTRPARTSAMAAQQQHYRNEQQLLGRGRPMPQQPPVPYRNTPTPPNVRPSSQASGYPGNHSNGAGPFGPPAQGAGQYPQHQNISMPTRSTPQPSANTPAFQPPYPGGYGMPQPGISVDALNNDIQQLIAASRAEFARNPHDPSIQTRLKALLDLQSILQTQNLPQDQLVLIKNRIAELAVTIRATPAQTPTPVPIAPAVAVAPPPSAPPAAPKVSLDSLLGPGALAALLARSSATPQVPTPQPPPATMAIRSPPPQRVDLPKPAAPAPSDALSLMDMLRKAGMIPPPPTGPASGSTPAPNFMPSTPSLPFPLPRPAVTGPPTVENMTLDISFTPSSLKQFRPHLIPLLFDSLGTQCTQCGRRFKNDAEGKTKKTAHMDWHFKVNQRIAEADKAGQNRGWLVDEQDWLGTRETIDVIGGVPTAQSNATQGGSVAKAPKMQYIPVPDDPVLLNSVCPICQEKFKQVYLDEEWVWEDALCVGDRIYHASCHREATGGSSSVAAVKYGGGSRSTPEPVLGKRKAEVVAFKLDEDNTFEYSPR
ncbi:mRNA cleavage factor complex component Pcf11 [Apiospora sp. TS-2023a]